MGRCVGEEGERASVDVRAWLFEQIHTDPEEARRVLRSALPCEGRGLVEFALAPMRLGARMLAGLPLHGIVAHRAQRAGREFVLLLVEARRGSCRDAMRRGVAAVARALRRSDPPRRVRVVFVAR